MGIARPYNAPDHPGMPICEEHAERQVFGRTEFFEAPPDEGGEDHG